MDYFKEEEFPDDISLAAPEIFEALIELRSKMNTPIYPSPVKGALARFEGSQTSQHYAVNRLSTGIDIFPEGMPIDILLKILSIKKIKGIGIYLDTTGNDGKPWVMFHIDIREKGFSDTEPLFWFCIKVNGKNKYLYPQRNRGYWSYFQDDRMHGNKKYGRS